MALFARRTIQRVLTENLSFLTKAQAQTICDGLNRPLENYLSLEWEQVILNLASKLGTVEYEKQFGSRTPDLHFRSAKGDFEFIADITAASDQGAEDLNRKEEFDREFERVVRKAGWQHGGFEIRIEHHGSAIYRGMKQ